MSDVRSFQYGPMRVRVENHGLQRVPYRYGVERFEYDVGITGPSQDDHLYMTTAFEASDDYHREVAQYAVNQLYAALEHGPTWPDVFAGGFHGPEARWRREKARGQVASAQIFGEERLLPAAAAVSRETTVVHPHEWSPRMNGPRMGDVTGALYTIVWRDPGGGMHRTEHTFEERWDAEVALRELEEAYEGEEGYFDIVTEVPFSAFGLEEL